jgi:hypothetical protein
MIHRQPSSIRWDIVRFSLAIVARVPSPGCKVKT